MVHVSDMSGKTVPETAQGRLARLHGYSGSMISHWLNPGDKFEENTVISELFVLSPGKYEIQLSRPISSDDPGKGIVKSTKIQIVVTP